MSTLLFESEVKQMIKMGIPQDLAILTASAKLEDKTIFNNTLLRMKQDNDVIEQELFKKGFKLSTDIVIDEPVDNKIEETEPDLVRGNIE